MDKGQRDHEGRVQPDSSHLYSGRHRYGFGSAPDDEFFPLRANRGREQGVAEAHLHHMGSTERPGVHHGLYHSVLCGWQVGWLMYRTNGLQDALHVEGSDFRWAF